MAKRITHVRDLPKLKMVDRFRCICKVVIADRVNATESTGFECTCKSPTGTYLFTAPTITLIRERK